MTTKELTELNWLASRLRTVAGELDRAERLLRAAGDLERLEARLRALPAAVAAEQPTRPLAVRLETVAMPIGASRVGAVFDESTLSTLKSAKKCGGHRPPF